jgi:peroxiredoxin
MKHAILFSTMIGVVAGLAMTLPVSTGNSAVKGLPDVQVKRLDGETVNIQEYGRNGKITILSFWATWCAPCKRELDAIMELYPEWLESYHVELVAVTIDNARALSKVRPMVEQKGWPFEILSDPNQELQQALNFQTIPQTFVVDQHGEIVYEHSGYQPGDEYELEEIISGLSE